MSNRVDAFKEHLRQTAPGSWSEFDGSAAETFARQLLSDLDAAVAKADAATKHAPLFERLLDKARWTVIASRREFVTGEVTDIDDLEDAIDSIDKAREP